MQSVAPSEFAARRWENKRRAVRLPAELSRLYMRRPLQREENAVGSTPTQLQMSSALGADGEDSSRE